MAEPVAPKEVVSIEELAISHLYEIEALIEVLTEKGDCHHSITVKAEDKPTHSKLTFVGT